MHELYFDIQSDSHKRAFSSDEHVSLYLAEFPDEVLNTVKSKNTNIICNECKCINVNVNIIKYACELFPPVFIN